MGIKTQKFAFSNFFKVILLACVLVFVVILGSACSKSDYSPKLKEAEITTPDILQKNVLKVGVDFDNPPLAGETTKPAGIDIDVASAISDELGLTVDFVDIGESPETFLEDKKVDIVMGLSKSSKISKIWKSDSYLESAVALFSTKVNTIPKPDTEAIIATQMASSGALAAQNQFNLEKVKLESNLKNCFESLANDDAQYVAADAIIGTYTAKTNEVDANMIALLSKVGGYCIGVLDTNTVLKDKISTIINKLVANGTVTIIEKKWLGKTLELNGIPLTEGAKNQADANELENGVYGEISGTAPQN